MQPPIDGRLFDQVQMRNAVIKTEKTILELFRSRPKWCIFSEKEFLQGCAGAFQNPGWIWVQIAIYHKEFQPSLLTLEDTKWISFIKHLQTSDKVMAPLAVYLYCILRVITEDSVIELCTTQTSQKISIAA